MDWVPENICLGLFVVHYCLRVSCSFKSILIDVGSGFNAVFVSALKSLPVKRRTIQGLSLRGVDKTETLNSNYGSSFNRNQAWLSI